MPDVLVGCHPAAMHGPQPARSESYVDHHAGDADDQPAEAPKAEEASMKVAAAIVGTLVAFALLILTDTVAL